MVKRMLWKDIRQTLSKSKGRVVSIVCLMALGSFALVGLKVTGPDMQATAADFYGRNNLADITVVSNYGISKDDERIIGKADGIKEVEYGYFKDVVISGTDRSMRIYSKPDAVSTYDVTEGRLPKRTGEIALDMKERDRFAVGSTLNVTEKTDIAGGTVLRHHKFTVVGFVRASETLSCLNMGQSTAGGGELKGYAVAVPGEFDSDVKMIARATYEDTEGLDYWSAEYRDAVQKHKDQLVTLLANQPKAREATIRSQQRKKIDEAKDKVKTSKQQLADAQRQLDDAKQQIDNAKDQLSEGLTSQGYCVYMVIEGIVAKLADIFPIFLYFVAALVTFSTMGRMVDEERTNSGTLKALGYGNADVMLKFTVYGFAASTLGTCIGVLAGHTLLPLIVAHAYSAGFTMPDIMLKFHPWITMAAFALAWISAVVPAWLAASKELREKPASLLLPKPPAKGSKILLEHFPPLWNRLNFTHKVTARNIFRYKTRMFMTIFGVCGAVSLLTAGLAVQSSIGQIGNRQFEELIHYDLIVAEESDTNSAQREEIATTLKGKTVQSSTAVRYEELSKTTGKENDKQSITLLATDDAYNFNEYLTLRDRKTHQPQILVNNGAVISERLAEMLNVSVGDTFTVNDENGAQRTIKVAGISEMYIGHFIFMNAQCYEHVFGDQYSTNAYMVRLKDHSNANTERQGAKFMKLAAVRGVVQNTTQKNMVSTIVGSLNQIMEVLILVAVLLAVVILYDLTNLNVSERIRELSTIKVLGFHTSETTMYIYRETILLSLLGILAGYGFGEWLHRYIITEVPPDEVMFDPAISWIALAAPAIVVAVVLAVLGWIVYRQLETVDMLEALKSVE